MVMSCEDPREVTCEAFDANNIILNYIMFEENTSSVEFSDGTETLSFIQNSLQYSESYIERCGGFPDNSCDCVAVFESVYLFNDFYLKTDSQIRLTEEDNISTVDINYQSNNFRWTSPQIPNNEAAIISFFDAITEDEIVIDGQLYTNVIILENLNEDNSETQRLFIKVGQGLIRFDYNNITYERLED